MIIASRTQFHIERLWGQRQFSIVSFNQEKALVGAFSVITNLRMDFFEALVWELLEFVIKLWRLELFKQGFLN